MTSFNQAANVTISEPANTTTNFPIINVTIPANSTNTVNLTTQKEQVECKPANTILNFGLHIHSDVPITAYYEEAHTNNPEIFTFKGNNALGTSFFIPSQDNLFNHSPLTPPAYNSFDIIATENATTVTITPKKAIVGHAAGVQFQVTLNKGQVYSAQATGQQGVDHLMGSTVTSDKPVAITVKDDSDQYPGSGNYDLTGDQIVPVNIIGTEYIVVRGFTNSTVNDWVYITATVDNTNIYLDGSSTPAATIMSGATYHYSLASTVLSSFIQTDQPAYVLHLTGYGGEVGSALLPPMDCTGSSQIAFTRSTQYSFELVILTKAGAQGSFVLDGNPSLVTAAMFSPVVGNPAFVYARISFTTASLPVGAHILANTQDIFHMGIIHTYDPSQLGCSYGYFTDFASLNLGPDQAVCPGASVTLDAGPNRQSYVWYFNGSIYATGVQTINVSAPGEYSVTVNDHGCILSDNVILSNSSMVSPVISGTTSFCQGTSQQLSVQNIYTSYMWTTGATTPAITVSSSGTYGVTVIDDNGCQAITSATVSVHPLPVVSFAQPASTCSNLPPFALSGGSPSPGIYSGVGVNSLTGFFDPASGSGTHIIIYTYTDGYGCVNTDSKTLLVNDPPTVQLADLAAVCVSAPPYQLSGGTPLNGVFSGTGVNSLTSVFDPSLAGIGNHIITYTYTDPVGCINSTSKPLTVNPLPAVTLSAQASVCISAAYLLTGGNPANGLYSGAGVNSLTSVFSPSVAGAGTHQITYTITDLNSCSNSANAPLIVNPLPVVQLQPFMQVCITAPPFLLTGGTPLNGQYSGIGVNTLTGMFDPLSGPGNHVITYTYADVNFCTNTATSGLFVNPLPVVTLADFTAVCISAAPFVLNGGNPGGGSYSGTGVTTSTSTFSPSTAGSGDHSITYTYSSAQGCTSSAVKNQRVTPIPIPSGIVTGPNPVCEAGQNLPYVLSGADPLATSFVWEINPSSAGTISGTNASPLVSLIAGYKGSAGIRFQPVSNCGSGNFSGYTSFTINPNPDVTFESCNDPVTTKGAKPVFLKGGIPPGGEYRIDGTPLPSRILDPASLSVSPPDHTVSYTYTNMYTCAITKTRSLRVNPASNFICKTSLTDPRDLKSYPTFEIISGGIRRC
ncbi:MAG: IgGFc-binding protein [Bacteroidota bacterium]